MYHNDEPTLVNLICRAKSTLGGLVMEAILNGTRGNAIFMAYYTNAWAIVYRIHDIISSFGEDPEDFDLATTEVMEVTESVGAELPDILKVLYYESLIQQELTSILNKITYSDSFEDWSELSKTLTLAAGSFKNIEQYVHERQFCGN